MEHEIALALTDNNHEAVRTWLSQQAHTTFTRRTLLLNIYLDTPKLDLARQKAALRLRFDAERQCWLQTLKTAGKIINGMSIRDEWECKIPKTISHTANIIPSVDIQLFPESAQIFLKDYIHHIQPVFRTDFTREIYDYQNGNQQFEWAFDDGAVIHTASGQQVAIHELELEYKSGDLNLMHQLALKVQTALHAQPQSISKAGQGYGLLLK